MSLVAAVLTDLYGPPAIDGDTYRWNAGEAELFAAPATLAPPGLLPWYGQFGGGGFLAGAALKLACADGRDRYGLYQLAELAGQPELDRVAELRPGLTFVLDAANVTFYGLEDGALLEFDADTGELTDLGDPDTALRTLVQEWTA